MDHHDFDIWTDVTVLGHLRKFLPIEADISTTFSIFYVKLQCSYLGPNWNEFISYVTNWQQSISSVNDSRRTVYKPLLEQILNKFFGTIWF